MLNRHISMVKAAEEEVTQKFHTLVVYLWPLLVRSIYILFDIQMLPFFSLVSQCQIMITNLALNEDLHSEPGQSHIWMDLAGLRPLIISTEWLIWIELKCCVFRWEVGTFMHWAEWANTLGSVWTRFTSYFSELWWVTP